MPEDAEKVVRVMISSTSIDLPEHREQAINACLRMDTKPEAMEHLPAADKDAIEVSLKMVDKADIYIGIYAWRYGYVPEGHEKSVTEMEFDHAVERGIPILIFLIHKDHPIKIEMVESGDETQKKLKALKERASKDRGRLEFKSPDDLRGHIVQSLGAMLKELEAQEVGEKSEPKAPQFHRVSTIPQAPEPYIAHPYSLLQTEDIVGRQKELRLLTEWVTEPKFESIRLFNIVAIGGMGKSALTWKWFQEIAPQELRGKLVGRMWWSFYESDAHFENFIIRALAYVSGQAEETVRKETKPGEREDQLLRILDEQPFLLTLDGLERILIAYARMDAARMLDDDLDEETMNKVFAEATGMPDGVRETYLDRHRLRMTADPRAGHFLRRLTKVRASRILITTRLYPADIQTQIAQPFLGCFAVFLDGLSDDDALQLWREFGVSGSSQQLLSLFRSVENYPLLIRALAGEVAEFRPAPGDFDEWQADNPDFNPAQLDLKNARTHILEYALQSLGESRLRVLHSIAAFSMPATFETIRALHVGEDKACATDRDLDAVLTELEDRGLLGWDKAANRYDLHPIVRGVVWDRVEEGPRKRIYTGLESYFDAAPKVKQDDVESLEDLTPAIELYRSLIGLERYQDAFAVFKDHLEVATLHRLSVGRQRTELLELLFLNSEAELPQLDSPRDQSDALNSLALGYKIVGEPGRALPPYRRAVEIDERLENQSDASVGLGNLASALTPAGHLREACHAALKGLKLARGQEDLMVRAFNCQTLGMALAASGVARESEISLRRSIMSFVEQSSPQQEGVSTAYLAQRALRFDDPAQAWEQARPAWDLAHEQRFERDFIRAARLQGAAALELCDFATATERLHLALTRARAVSHAEEELPALTALAEMHRRQGKLNKARELLDAVWEPALRGPYPLFHADARNVLAQIEIDAGNHDAAVEAATRAYELAWCDGPPYAYAYGLKHAKKLLAQLGAPEPELPPFDESKFEPLPDVEINPKDEYWVDPDKLSELP